MRVGKHIRVDAQGEAGLPFQLAGASSKQHKLGLALHIELQNTGLEPQVDLRGCLAYAGEHDALNSLRRDGQYTLQLATGDDVETCAVFGKKLENCECRVGLDGIADQMIAAAESLLKHAQPLQNLIGGVYIERRAVAGGERFERHLAAVQRALCAGMLKGPRWGAGDRVQRGFRQRMRSFE